MDGFDLLLRVPKCWGFSHIEKFKDFISEKPFCHLSSGALRLILGLESKRAQADHLLWDLPSLYSKAVGNNSWPKVWRQVFRSPRIILIVQMPHLLWFLEVLYELGDWTFVVMWVVNILSSDIYLLTLFSMFSVHSQCNQLFLSWFLLYEWRFKKTPTFWKEFVCVYIW